MNKLSSNGSAQLKLYASLLAFVLLCMVGLRYCSNPPVGKEKERRASQGDTIDVAISYSPVTLYRYADTLGGFGYDMLRAIEKQNEMVFKLHPVTSLEMSLNGLDEGLYDVVVYNVAKTADIDKRFVFTEPVGFDKQVLIQKCDTTGNIMVKNQLDLARKRVWVEAASPAVLRLKHLSAEIGDTIFVESVNDYSSEQLFIMTAIGEIPLSVVNENVARQLAVDYPQVDISTDVSFTQFQAWIIRAADSISINRINSAITNFKNTSDYSRLLKQYNLE